MMFYWNFTIFKGYKFAIFLPSSSPSECSSSMVRLKELNFEYPLVDNENLRLLYFLLDLQEATATLLRVFPIKMCPNTNSFGYQ